MFVVGDSLFRLAYHSRLLFTPTSPCIWFPLSTALVRFGYIIVCSLPLPSSHSPPDCNRKFQPSGIKYASFAACSALSISNQQMQLTLTFFLHTHKSLGEKEN